jgi:hypothetical protein
VFGKMVWFFKEFITKVKNSFFIGERAQAAAPFELLVAVVIMSFVMVVGYVVLDDVNTQVCLQSVDREMTEFKLAMEDSVARMSSAPLAFRPQGSCFSSKKSELQIYNEETRAVCAAVCGFASDECYIMKFTSELPGSTKRKCLNLPPYTNFQVDMCVDEQLSGTGYAPIDPTVKGEFLAGSYVIRNVSPAGHPFPLICVWYKA